MNITGASGQGNESALWEISGNGLKKKSYLLGTVHSASSEIFFKFSRLKWLVEGAEIGIFEVKGKPVGDQHIIHELAPQPPLDSIFTPSEYKLVDDFFSKSPLGSIRPHNNEASLDGMLQAAVTYKTTKGKQHITFDNYLNGLMDSLGKDIFQLDNINDPSKLIFQSQFRILAETLLAVIKTPDASVAKKIVPFDYERHLKVNLQLSSPPDQLIGQVTIDRNRIWLPKIIEKMKENSCFIAVGIGHLQYNTGLIILLRRKGYKLKPINVVDK